MIIDIRYRGIDSYAAQTLTWPGASLRTDPSLSSPSFSDEVFVAPLLTNNVSPLQRLPMANSPHPCTRTVRIFRELWQPYTTIGAGPLHTKQAGRSSSQAFSQRRNPPVKACLLLPRRTSFGRRLSRLALPPPSTT